MKKDNKGFSLVELIVVMAIMIIIVSGTIVGVRIITGKPAQQCAEQMRTVILSGRTNAMGRENATVSLYKDASTGQIMASVSQNGSVKTQPIGAKGVDVTFQLEGESTPRELPTSPNAIVIGFDRSSGAMKPILAESNVPLAIQGKKLQYLFCHKADRDFKLTIYSLTGRIVLEEI